MSITRLVVSDLHLADGHPIFDGFEQEQQRAWESFLQATSPGGPLGQTDEVELIINGDCFDFLAVPPYRTQGISSAALALEKLEAILAAHGPFFETLRTFLQRPQRRVTFITGNHDLDLCFEEVRTRLKDVLGAESASETPAVAFWPTLRYRPESDVVIEHGNRYDFWNHRTEGLWDAQGRLLTPRPERILLSPGAWYHQEVGLLIHGRYPYLSHLEPSMSYPQQIALLSLLDPTLVREAVERIVTYLAEPRRPLEALDSTEEPGPARLFEAAMLDFAAFQSDARARKTDWTPVVGWDEQQAARATIEEFLRLREILERMALPEAVARILTLPPAHAEDTVMTGLRSLLEQEHGLRSALAGHTHSLRLQRFPGDRGVYLNTGTWTRRFARPASAEVTPALIEWLRQPDWHHVPLRNVTQYSFALLLAEDHAGPASIRLCAWEPEREDLHVLA